MKLCIPIIVALVLLTVACRGDDGKGTPAVRELKDPRTAPTATVPPQIPSPIPALELTGGVRRGTGAAPALPDSYVVKAGDTLAGIALELGVTLDDLTKANTGVDARNLKVGQQLKVPRPTPSPTPARTAITGTTRPGTGTATGTRPAGVTATATGTALPTSYTVQAGDTGCKIATQLGVPLTELARVNNTTIDGLAALQVGQSLRVPSARGAPGC